MIFRQSLWTGLKTAHSNTLLGFVEHFLEWSAQVGWCLLFFRWVQALSRFCHRCWLKIFNQLGSQCSNMLKRWILPAFHPRLVANKWYIWYILVCTRQAELWFSTGSFFSRGIPMTWFSHNTINHQMGVPTIFRQAATWVRCLKFSSCVP